MLSGRWWFCFVLFLVELAYGLNRCKDLNGDGYVNLRDYAVLAGGYGQASVGDIDNSGETDNRDLALLAGEWLGEVNCSQYYAHTLPYSTSFEAMNGFILGPLDYQQGWQVPAGVADVNEEVYYVWDQTAGDWVVGGDV